MQSVVLISITRCLLCSDPLEFVTASRRAQKVAVGKALSCAFQKILLVVLGEANFCIKHEAVWANDIITHDNGCEFFSEPFLGFIWAMRVWGKTKLELCECKENPTGGQIFL